MLISQFFISREAESEQTVFVRTAGWTERGMDGWRQEGAGEESGMWDGWLRDGVSKGKEGVMDRQTTASAHSQPTYSQ